MSDLHVHLPEGFSGIVHIHRDGDVATISAGSAEATTTASTADVEAILSRHETHDLHSNSRQVYEALLADGWQPYPPTARSGDGPSNASYIRMVYTGNKYRSVLYLNSVALVSSGAADREFLSGLPGADVRTSEVYLNHSGDQAEQAIANAAALRARADGEDVTA